MATHTACQELVLFLFSVHEILECNVSIWRTYVCEEEIPAHLVFATSRPESRKATAPISSTFIDDF